MHFQCKCIMYPPHIPSRAAAPSDASCCRGMRLRFRPASMSFKSVSSVFGLTWLSKHRWGLGLWLAPDQSSITLLEALKSRQHALLSLSCSKTPVSTA